jgi:LysR family hydrogen peroxide-inducible transcriptional activator
MISLKQLRYFDALVRFGHFGKAADHCAVTQPALSMQIQELERELGTALVERRPRRVLLTEAGQEIASRAARVLGEIRDIADVARASGGVLSGPLSLGVIPTVAPYLLPPLLPRLQARYPRLELRVRETQTSTLTEELIEGKLDLLLLAMPIIHPEIETLDLFEDRFLLATSAKDKAARGRPATVELLKRSRLLLLEEGHCLRDQALAFCQLRDIRQVDTFGASSLSTLVQMVANDMGLTLLPEISVAFETARVPLRLARFEKPEPSRVLGLAWRSSSPRKDDFAKLGELITAGRSASPRRAPK